MKKNFNPGAGGRLIDLEKRINTVLKIRPGHSHDVDKKKKLRQFNPRIKYFFQDPQ